MMLTAPKVVRIQLNVRAHEDQRRKVDRYIVSYYGSDSHEYRKSFEFPVGTVKPAIPETLED